MYSAFGASSTHNTPLTSKLTEEQRKQLCDLLGKVKLTLLYKASVHGYQASAFHQRCDRQGPTLVVAYNYSGYIFGGYTSVDYARSRKQITDNQAFLFSVHDGAPLCIKVNSGHYARYDDAGGPNFGQQLYFCDNNQPYVYNQDRNEYHFDAVSGIPIQQRYQCGNAYNRVGVNAFSFSSARLYGDDTWLSECEVYKVEQRSTLSEPQVSADKPWRNVLWTPDRRAELMEMIRNYKPLVTSVSRVRILMIGPVGAGKSSFFNSINSIFMGRMTSKAMSGSAGTSLTTQFRTYPVKDGRGGKLLPFVLCDTMGLQEQTGAGLDIEDISSILQGHVPDRYKFNPVGAGKSSFFNSINSIFMGLITSKAMSGFAGTSLTTQFNPIALFQPDEQKASRPASLQEKIHCVVYMIDATKISLMSDKLEEKLASIRRKVNSMSIAQLVLMTKVDEACPLVEKDLQNTFVSSYIKSKVQEVSSRLGVPVSCVLPVKNYSQEMELELNCDVLLLTALQQMLNFADDYLDDADHVEGNI